MAVKPGYFEWNVMDKEGRAERVTGQIGGDGRKRKGPECMDLGCKGAYLIQSVWPTLPAYSPMTYTNYRAGIGLTEAIGHQGGCK